MNKTNWFIGLSIISSLSFASINALPPEGEAQHGHGRGGGMGYGMGRGMMGGEVNVPDKLPTPKNAEWIQKLREALVIEKKSSAQYIADAAKYNASLPYTMIIPQEEYHIQLIEKLFAAYGLKVEGKAQTAENTENLKAAMELCIKTEKDLISRYTWLIQNTEDKDSAIVLNRILLQTRWHLAMFEHSIGMGGKGMGPGMHMMESGQMH